MLHIYLPLVLRGIVLVHMQFLHEVGSNNPLGVEEDGNLIPFHPYYSHKDFVGILVIIG